MTSLNDIKQTIDTKGKYWIVFTGDSITSCEWVHPNWRAIVEYVLKDKLEYDWGIKAFNFAYDGSTTADLLSRFGEFLVLKPDLVICATGANDPFAGIDLANYRHNIDGLINRAKENKIPLVLATDNCPDNEWAKVNYREYVEAVKDIPNLINLFEESQSFPMERIYTFIAESDIPKEKVIKGGKDFWHPNQLGNAYIAKVILKKVFDIEFDPEKFWQETLRGEKLPRY